MALVGKAKCCSTGSRPSSLASKSPSASGLASKSPSASGRASKTETPSSGQKGEATEPHERGTFFSWNINE